MAGYTGRAERHAVIALSDWRFWARCAALAVLAAGLVVRSMTVTQRVYDVVAVLDITGSMNVVDQAVDGQPATRIAMEKRATHRLLAQLPCGSKLGLAIFVEKQPFLLFKPVETCGNYSALDAEIGAIDWRMGWDSESHIAETLLASMAIGARVRCGSDFHDGRTGDAAVMVVRRAPVCRGARQCGGRYCGGRGYAVFRRSRNSIFPASRLGFSSRAMCRVSGTGCFAAASICRRWMKGI